MILRFQYEPLTKFICFMLPSFFISCQSVEEDDITHFSPLVSSQEYVYIPIKRVLFDYYDKKKWRFITQQIDYIDGKNMQSLSSLWVFDYMPIEIIVLDNPDINESVTFDFQESNGISFRKTNIYLPFKETTESDDLDDQLPTCKGTEFRAIARIVSNLKYIGIHKLKNNNEVRENDLRNWFSLGEIICLNIVRL